MLWQSGARTFSLHRKWCVRLVHTVNRSRPSHAAPPRRHPIVQHITLVTYPHVMRHPPCTVSHTCVTQHACPTAPVRRSSTSRHCHRRSRVSPHSCSHILWSRHSDLCRKRRRRRRRRRQRQAAMPIKAPRRAAQSINSSDSATHSLRESVDYSIAIVD